MADPGFPRGGGANSPGGAPTYDFANFPRKLHEIERIWTPGGGASKILLCRSATANYKLNKNNCKIAHERIKKSKRSFATITCKLLLQPLEFLFPIKWMTHLSLEMSTSVVWE